MSTSRGRHRRTRTLQAAVAVAVTAGLAGVWLTGTPDDANAATTVVVSTTPELEKAFAQAGPGTTVQLRGGTYRPARSLKSQADGTAHSRITVTAYRAEKAVVDGSALPDGDWLVAIGGDHWTLSGLTFRNSRAHGVVVTSSVGGIFRNLTTHGNGDSGFTLRGEGTTDNLVENLDSYDNYDAKNHGQNADGLAIKFGSGTGNRIVGARLHHNADDGVDLWQWASPVRIERSWAYGNGVNRWQDPAFEGNGNGFKLGGGGASAAHVITGNAAWDNEKHGFTDNSNPGALRLHRNTAYANDASGFYLASSPSRLSRNLALDNATGAAKLGRRVVSAANSWDANGAPVAGAVSTDPATAYGPRRADGALPATEFLATGTPAVGAEMP
ncbi:right-handed parallel beta-helix repeat-containing protein [Streptomyces sp. SID14515]|uniref:right-handed parallel beta-helix repeat-containing protein n=1 Tax=Streptomyces sp. SID14515 TaxID=2706074 RepID=UPI0013CC3688|nr:pectate lyase [Streptomyces sp. SID14515]